jgi:hypothetical protein
MVAGGVAGTLSRFLSPAPAHLTAHRPALPPSLPPPPPGVSDVTLSGARPAIRVAEVPLGNAVCDGLRAYLRTYSTATGNVRCGACLSACLSAVGPCVLACLHVADTCRSRSAYAVTSRHTQQPVSLPDILFSASPSCRAPVHTPCGTSASASASGGSGGGSGGGGGLATDVCLLNGGSMRANINQGNITSGGIYSVLVGAS